LGKLDDNDYKYLCENEVLRKEVKHSLHPPGHYTNRCCGHGIIEGYLDSEAYLVMAYMALACE